MKLDGKQVLVTGGSIGGIGFDIARTLLAKGAKVAITGRRASVVSAAVEELRETEGTPGSPRMSVRRRGAPRPCRVRSVPSAVSTSWSTTSVASEPAGWRRRPRPRSRRC